MAIHISRYGQKSLKSVGVKMKDVISQYRKARFQFPILLPNFHSITLELLHLTPHFVIVETLRSNIVVQLLIGYQNTWFLLSFHLLDPPLMSRWESEIDNGYMMLYIS